MRVHWTDTAISHLRSIHAYIGQSSPEYALRIVDRLTRCSQQIGALPQSGRIVPEVDLPQIREVLEGPYRVIYHKLFAQRAASEGWEGSGQVPFLLAERAHSEVCSFDARR